VLTVCDRLVVNNRTTDRQSLEGDQPNYAERSGTSRTTCRRLVADQNNKHMLVSKSPVVAGDCQFYSVAASRQLIASAAV